MKGVVLMMVIFGVILFTLEAQDKEKLPSELQRKIRSLVKKLEADNLQERESAYNRLLKELQKIETCQTLADAVAFIKDIRARTTDQHIKDSLTKLLNHPIVRFCMAVNIREGRVPIWTLLRSKELDDHRKAVNLLYNEIERGKRDYIYSLFAVLKYPSFWQIREFAMEKLVKVGKPAVEMLIEALMDIQVPYDEEWWVREIAAKILGRIGDKRAVKALTEALRDPSENVRSAAAMALYKIPDERAIEPLIRALKDHNEFVRLSAMDALNRIGKPVIEPLVKAFIKDKDVLGFTRTVMRALCRMKDEWMKDKRLIKPLIKALKDKDWEVRRVAIYVFERIGEPAVEPIIKVLKDEKWQVRRDAAKVLGKIGDKRAVEPLIKALKDKCKWVRSATAYALGEIGDKRAVEPLIKALKDDDKNVRCAAVKALGKIGDKRAIEPLIKVLMDEALKGKYNWVRTAAADVLGRIGDERAIEPLIKALKDEDWRVSSAAAEALRKITGQNFGQDYDKWLNWFKQQFKHQQ